MPFIRLLLVSCFSISTIKVLAEDTLPYAPTKAELEVLPKACDARLNGDDATKHFWDQKIGVNNFLHLHHFCFALNFMNRARFTVDKKSKRGYLNMAIQNFAYVLKNWPQDSPLRPDAESGMREAQVMLKALPN